MGIDPEDIVDDKAVDAATAAKDAGAKAGGALETAADKADEVAQKAGKAAADAAQEAGDKAKEVAQNIGEQAAEAAGNRKWYQLATHTKEGKFSGGRTAAAGAGTLAAILAARYALGGDEDKTADTWHQRAETKTETGVAGQGR